MIPCANCPLYSKKQLLKQDERRIFSLVDIFVRSHDKMRCLIRDVAS